MLSHSATFLFNDRQRFDARSDHDLLRSSLPVDFDVPPTADPWKRSPIDFTPKNFHPSRKKHPRALSTTDLSVSREKREPTAHSLDTSVMQPFAMPYETTEALHQYGLADGFVLDTRVNYDPVQRTLNRDQYRNPRPHDYRQVNIYVVVTLRLAIACKLVSRYQRARSAGIPHRSRAGPVQPSISLRSLEYV